MTGSNETTSEYNITHVMDSQDLRTCISRVSWSDMLLLRSDRVFYGFRLP
jgi:hypothetical protein